MRRSGIKIAFLLMACCASGPNAFTCNGIWDLSSAYYSFSETTGVLTIKQAGLWFVVYQDIRGEGTYWPDGEFFPPGWHPVDIPGVQGQDGGDAAEFKLQLIGKNIVGSSNLNPIETTTPAWLQLDLRDGGGIAPGITVQAFYCNLYDSVGAMQLQLHRTIGPAPAVDPQQAAFYGAFTRQPLEVSFSAADQGQVATYFARWATRTGLVGPWSLPVHMTVAGGSAGAPEELASVRRTDA